MREREYENGEERKKDEGLREELTTLVTLVDALEDHVDAIDTRLFGERPTAVSKGESKDMSVPAVARSVELITKRLSILNEKTSGIRGRL